MAAFDDKLFDEYIAVDEDDDEKENQDEIQSVKKPRPTKEQYNKISEFYDVHNEDSIEKSVFNELWGNLAAELNDIGPPAFTEAEWRRKWSVQKYNTKKRRLKMLADSEIRCDEAAHSSTGPTGDNQQIILRKLDEILTKQNVLLENQNTLIGHLNTLPAFPKQT